MENFVLEEQDHESKHQARNESIIYFSYKSLSNKLTISPVDEKRTKKFLINLGDFKNGGD